MNEHRPAPDAVEPPAQAPRLPEDILEAAGAKAARRLEELLEEFRQVEAWLRLDLPAMLVDHLLGIKADIVEEAMELLDRWLAAGGSVALLPHRARERVSTPLPATPGPHPDTPAEPPPAPDAEPPPAHDPPPPGDEGTTPAESQPPTADAAAPEAGHAPEVPDETPPAPPATTDALRRLQEAAHSGGLHNLEPEVQHRAWLAAAEKLVQRVDPGGMDETACRHAIRFALDGLEDFAHAPKRVQRSVIGLLTCALRHAQDEIDGEVAPKHRLDRAFSRLSTFSKTRQPGFVHGLMRDHRPERGSWREDARQHHRRILKLLEPHSERGERPTAEALLHRVAQATDDRSRVAAIHAALDGGVSANDPRLVRMASPLLDGDHLAGPDFRNLRRAIRNAGSAGEGDDEPTEDASDISEDWPWLAVTRGRQAAIVGGDAREPNRQRIQAAFRFAELDWIEEPGPRQLRSLAERVRRGSVRFVIQLIGFSGHDVDHHLSEVCKQHGVPLVRIPRGYGTARIRCEIENQVPRPDPDASPAA